MRIDMGIETNIFITLLLLGLVVRSTNAATKSTYDDINRASFPEGFVFGTASSAYQYEGAAAQDGRGPSIWDAYTHKYPEKISDHSNGDVAIDSYHRSKEDVGIMKEMGMNAYRFSISWSRILPSGKLSGGVNRKGIMYYNNLINQLLANGIQPFVTLFHWDLPQTLEEEYRGFLNSKIVDDFKDYVEVCFKEFGDRVKHWMTLNEPSSYSYGGYVVGLLAPGRCSAWLKLNCTDGDSATEPYIVTHNQLLAHAAAVKLYKEKYQATQRGLIGIVLVTNWFVPISNCKRDRKAAERALDFNLGWFMNPLIYGDYPHSMRSLVGKRLPKFSLDESKMVKFSFDFIGLNYYTSSYAAYMPPVNAINVTYSTDAHVILTSERNGIPIGPQAASPWICIYPRGIRNLLLYAKRKYKNPLIYITENGIDEFNNATLTLEEALNDRMRVSYYHSHLSSLRKAIMDGANVKGYFAWSLLDNFEWKFGYTVRFGINYVDYENGLKRYPKLSSHWFKNFLKV